MLTKVLPVNPTNIQSGQVVRKQIKVSASKHQQDSHKHMNSNQSLSNHNIITPGIKSSIFRVEPPQDYTDLRLDFTSGKVGTEYQSQSYLASSTQPEP